MSAKSVGFVGAGRVAGIFLGGWSRGDRMPEKVVVFDANPEVSENLRAAHPGLQVGNLSEAAAQDVVFLAVHPPVIGEVVPLLAPHLRPGAVLVSLAPKFTVGRLSAMLGGFARIARVIPNAASAVGKGYNPAAFGEALSEQDCCGVCSLLEPLGECVEVPEAQLETYAVVTAMGLTFMWPQLEMLVSLAESAGLSRDAALVGVGKMLVGAVATMRDSGLPPAGVMDLVPVRPLAEEVGAFVGVARPKLEGLLAKLHP